MHTGRGGAGGVKTKNLKLEFNETLTEYNVNITNLLEVCFCWNKEELNKSLSLKKHWRIFGTSFVFEFEETKKNYSIRTYILQVWAWRNNTSLYLKKHRRNIRNLSYTNLISIKQRIAIRSLLEVWVQWKILLVTYLKFEFDESWDEESDSRQNSSGHNALKRSAKQFYFVWKKIENLNFKLKLKSHCFFALFEIVDHFRFTMST